MTKFEFIDFLPKCKMTYESKRPARKNTFVLTFQLDAFSEEMATRFDNIEEDKFKDCLQEEMSKNKENVTITGINE